MTVLVALIALCVVDLVLIWQVSTLIGMVDELQEDMHATARWIARMEAYRVRVAGRQSEKEDEDEDED